MILKKFNIEKNVDDKVRIAELKAKGFVEVGGKKEAEPAPEKPIDDLKKLTKAELVEMAEDQGVENAKSMKKDELISVLQ